jgi:P-type conjugative transfer protein TrbL
MLNKLLAAIVLLLHIGLSFAQNAPKPPPSPFSFDGKLNISRLPNTVPPLTMPRANNANINNTNNINALNGGNVTQANGMLIANASPTQLQQTAAQAAAQQANISNNANAANVANAANTTGNTFQDAYQNMNQALYPDSNPNSAQDLAINNISEDVYKIFKDNFSNAAKRLMPYVLYLFYALALFSILLLFLMNTAQGGGFKNFMVHFSICIFHLFFWHGLIFNYSVLAEYIPNFFSKIGGHVADVPISEGDILDYGVNYIKRVWQTISAGGAANIGRSLMYILLSVPTFFMILLIVKVYVYTLIRALVIGQINIIYLAFAGYSKTEEYAKKPFVYLINTGLKLMFLQIFFGVILTMMKDYSTRPISENVVLVMLIVAVISYFLVNDLLSMIDDFITVGGSSGMSSGSFKTALKDTLLDTYRAAKSINQAKKMVSKGHQMAQMRHMERMSDPDYAQRFAPKFTQGNQSNSSAASNSSSNSSAAANGGANTNKLAGNHTQMQQQDMGMTNTSVPKKDTADTVDKAFQESNTSNVFHSDSFAALNSEQEQAFKPPKDAFKSTFNAATPTTSTAPETENHISAAHMPVSHSNQETTMQNKQNAHVSQGNNNMQNAHNAQNIASQSTNQDATQKPYTPYGKVDKAKDILLGTGYAVKALADSGFNLEQANARMDYGLSQSEMRVQHSLMQNKTPQQKAQEVQEELWGKIAAGKSPSSIEEARKYLTHGNELKKNNAYAQQHADFLRNKRNAALNLASFTTESSLDVPPIMADTKTDTEKIDA